MNRVSPRKRDTPEGDELSRNREAIAKKNFVNFCESSSKNLQNFSSGS